MNRSFRKSITGKSIESALLYCLKNKVGGEMRDYAEGQGQQEARPINPRYKEWKIRNGYSEKKWILTGKFISSLDNDPPMKTGNRKGLRFGIDWKRNPRVWIRPNVLYNYFGEDFRTVYFGKQFNLIFRWRAGDAAQVKQLFVYKLRQSLKEAGFQVK